MGGKALSNPSPRMLAADYHAFSRRMLSRLRGATSGARFEVIPAYGRKDSFGDMDIVVDWGDGCVATANREAALAAIEPTEVVTNGDVTSVGVRGDAVSDPFQLDLIAPGSAFFDFTLSYFSFNDLGNLLGRVAHLAGFKLGHRGLRYVVRNPRHDHHVIDEVLVTLDWDGALAFLGFEASAYAAGAAGGFQSLEDIFRFVVSTPHFHAESYYPENMNHAARTRDANRPTYAAFLRWLDTTADLPAVSDGRGWSDKAARRGEFLDLALSMFPQFRQRYDAAIVEAERESAAKDRLDATKVAAMTGTWGKALGDIMRNLNATFPDRKTKIQWILEASDRELEGLVQAAAEEVLATHDKQWGSQPAR